jgi:hypothetical protein
MGRLGAVSWRAEANYRADHPAGPGLAVFGPTTYCTAQRYRQVGGGVSVGGGGVVIENADPFKEENYGLLWDGFTILRRAIFGNDE